MPPNEVRTVYATYNLTTTDCTKKSQKIAWVAILDGFYDPNIYTKEGHHQGMTFKQCCLLNQRSRVCIGFMMLCSVGRYTRHIMDISKKVNSEHICRANVHVVYCAACQKKGQTCIPACTTQVKRTPYIRIPARCSKMISKNSQSDKNEHSYLRALVGVLGTWCNPESSREARFVGVAQRNII